MKFVFIPGDGVGNEISAELIKIGQALENYTNIKFNIQTFDLGLKHYLDTGIFVPDGVIKECKQAMAIWVGPLTDKTGDGVPIRKSIIGRLITGLNISTFIRRIVPFNPNINLLTSEPFDVLVLQDCIDYGSNANNFTTNITAKERMTFDISITTNSRVVNLLNYAIKLTENNERHKITVALPDDQITSDNPWIIQYKKLSLSKDLPISIISIDRLVFRLLHRPVDLDIILTIPPYGTLLSKLGAALEGGLGLAYESYVNPEGLRLFHVLHPPSDRFVGKDAANPIGAIRALADILYHVNRPVLGRAIEQAVRSSLEAGWSTRDMGGSMGTVEIGDFICNKISEIMPG